MNEVKTYCWGFLTAEDIKHLGFITTPSEEYTFLTKLDPFQDKMEEALKLENSVEARKQLALRVNVLKQALFVTGQAPYLEAIEKLSVRYPQHLYSTDFHDLVEVLKEFEPNWKLTFQKCCELWQRCKPFSEKARRVASEDVAYLEDSDFLLKQKFFYSASNIYDLIQRITPLFLQWKKCLEKDYGFLKLSTPLLSASTCSKEEYQILLNCEGLLKKLEQTKEKAKGIVILYQINRRLIALLGAALKTGDEAYLNTLDKLLTADSLLMAYIRTPEQNDLEEIKIKAGKVRKFLKSREFTYEWSMEWTSIKDKCLSHPDLKRLILDQIPDFFDQFEERRLDTVFQQFTTFIIAKNIFNKWLDSPFSITDSNLELRIKDLSPRSEGYHSFKPPPVRRKTSDPKPILPSKRMERSRSLSIEKTSSDSANTDSETEETIIDIKLSPKEASEILATDTRSAKEIQKERAFYLWAKEKHPKLFLELKNLQRSDLLLYNILLMSFVKNKSPKVWDYFRSNQSSEKKLKEIEKLCLWQSENQEVLKAQFLAIQEKRGVKDGVKEKGAASVESDTAEEAPSSYEKFEESEWEKHCKEEDAWETLRLFHDWAAMYHSKDLPLRQFDKFVQYLWFLVFRYRHSVAKIYRTLKAEEDSQNISTFLGVGITVEFGRYRKSGGKKTLRQFLTEKHPELLKKYSLMKSKKLSENLASFLKQEGLLDQYQALQKLTLYEYLKQENKPELMDHLKDLEKCETETLDCWAKSHFHAVYDLYKKSKEKKSLREFLKENYPEIDLAFQGQRSAKMNANLTAWLREENPSYLEKYQSHLKMTMKEFLKTFHRSKLIQFQIITDSNLSNETMMNYFKQLVADGSDWIRVRNITHECIQILKIKYKRFWGEFEKYQNKFAEDALRRELISFLKKEHREQFLLLDRLKKNFQALLYFYVQERKQDIWGEYKCYTAELKFLKLEGSVDCTLTNSASVCLFHNHGIYPSEDTPAKNRSFRKSLFNTNRQSASLPSEWLTLPADYTKRREFYIFLLRNSPYFYRNIIDAISLFNKPENAKPELTEIIFKLPLESIEKSLLLYDPAIKSKALHFLGKHGEFIEETNLSLDITLEELNKKLKRHKKIAERTLYALKSLSTSPIEGQISFMIDLKELQEAIPIKDEKLKKKVYRFIKKIGTHETRSITVFFQRNLHLIEEKLDTVLREQIVKFLLCLNQGSTRVLVPLTSEEVIQKLESGDPSVQKEIMDILDRIPFNHLTAFKIKKEAVGAE